MSYRLTAESEAAVRHAVGQAEETREQAPLAPIHLELRSAQHLLRMWHETEEALNCRGFLRPIGGIKSSNKTPGIDSRIYLFVESCIGAYLASNENMKGLDLRAVLRHWLGESLNPLHLSDNPTKEQGQDEMLRWLGTDREGFVRKMVVNFANYLDLEKSRKSCL